MSISVRQIAANPHEAKKLITILQHQLEAAAIALEPFAEVETIIPTRHRSCDSVHRDDLSALTVGDFRIARKTWKEIAP